MLGHKLMFGDVDQQITLLEMFGGNATLGKRLKSTHSSSGYGTDSNEDTVCIISVKMLGKLSKMFNANRSLWTEFDPDVARCCGRIFVGFGRKRCMKLVHGFAWFGVEAHELAT